MKLFEIPNNLKDYLEIEDCSNFKTDGYFVTDRMEELITDIKRTTDKANIITNVMKMSYPNTVLLYGMPGTGKTSFCKYLAYEFKLPFVYISFAKVFDGIFGKTTGIISDIFDFLLDKECIFCLDEIDCVSQKRGTESDATGGEIARVTVTIMQCFDKFRLKNAKPIIIGATNRADIMDTALKSRFSVVKELPTLTNLEKEQYIVGIIESININLSAADMKPVTYDVNNIREYCARGSMISQRNVEMDILRCISTWLDNQDSTLMLNHIKEGSGIYEY